MKSKHTSAAMFYPAADGGYSVLFPQLEGCMTQGDNFDDVANMAREAMSLHLYGMEQDGIPIPEERHYIPADDGGKVVLISAWMQPFRDEMRNRSVKKTVTIPAWVNEAGEAAGVNFSQPLQTAIKNYLNIPHPRA